PSVYDISRENPIVKQLRTLILKFPSSVDTSLAEAVGVKSSVLFRASNVCESASGTFSIDPLHKFSDSDYTKNGLPLAASFEGKFKSWFLDKDPASNIDISPETRIVAVGTGGFATDNFARNPDNIALFANIVDYLADDTGLISIRSKNVSMPPLEELEPGTKKLVKFSNMLLAPILVVLIGLLVWRRRASCKRKFEEELNRKSELNKLAGEE
ncbi:MAG: hypothetical protein KAH48_03075, partial [Chlorobi bacterium]|nr:hypothetical protein [Chlorobiota bacterium]